MENNLKTGAKGVFPGTSNTVGSIEPSRVQQGDTQISNPSTTADLPKAPITPNIEQSSSEVDNSTSTYIKVDSKNSNQEVTGVLEVDLISFREKGFESRYLTISSNTADESGNNNSTVFYIDNENDFNRFKEFISNLNWND